MRFRGKSIRRKIVALLLVPLVSLTAIWGFATVLTGREAARLFQVTDVQQDIAYPAEDAIRVLQQERRQTLVYLADPRAADAVSALRRTRAATDRALAKIRRNAGGRHVFDGLDVADNERLTAVLDAFDGLDSLRHGVEQGTVTRAQAYDLYNRLVDPCFTLLASLEGIDDVALDAQARAMVNIGRARELLSREDALLGSSLVVGRLTRAERRAIADLAAQRTVLYDVSLPLLPAAERDRYEGFWKNAATAPLRTAERTVIDAESGTPRGVTAQSWDSAAASALDDLGTLDDQVGDRFQDRTRPVAVGVIVQAAVAGLLGLVALVASLVVSVRIGRRLVRDLRRLRTEAHEASGVRLPSVMRRLSAGEQVDVETEVPRLEYDKNEIGEVGQALNTLQRAAVEAAVKQAELRAGVSEVFVNLARRSQVLLHKQLTLLDTMERRTEDTDELADLFRLDHLTTRMRRHAEGLVILSGAAPSRQWRRPVQLMDVVRAAVAEVEDYERVEVRRLPRVAVTGPAVADLTHLVAELLENATVFSPPHTAVQVLGERVANGFTLEIHDRGLGMTAEALLEANLRLAETPEFELSDTDRLGLFVVSRLAQRQNVRVSLQPSPYGGTTAVVFIPDALLSDDVPDTNGLGFRLDRDRPAKGGAQAGLAGVRSMAPAPLPGLPTSLLDGPVELEAPVDLDALDDFPGVLADEDSTRGGLFRPRRSGSGADDTAPAPSAEADDTGPIPLPRRQTPKLVSSHGRPVTGRRSRRDEPDPHPSAGSRSPGAEGPAPLPTRRRTPTRGQPADPADRAGEREATALESSDVPALPRRTRTTPSAEPPGRTAEDREALAAQNTDAVPDAPALPRRTRPTPSADGTEGMSGGAALPRRTGSTASVEGAEGMSGGAALARRARSTPSAEGIEGASDGAAAGDSDAAEPSAGPLPRRIRQASLAPQLKQDTAPRAERGAQPADRDAEEVRSRMASLQRGWQRGRRENAAGDDAHDGTAQGTTKGDGR
ncbi:sensor histidine kinase [Streptomyces sp. NBC_00557]|uniref:sensor histidine kinase n=1 Tax=Streptomyces sp. NBC_00557 TaxID=2975776 RepID=UPI002E801B7A|nr:nitrate- and nitrite sensing domain-containing protein [Streptomyces sp. NBC_00557]WUC38287.1 nitrate- and nitrite sensing domain-containing protein [Streptomyces sp. NBC_00557]